RHFTRQVAFTADGRTLLAGAREVAVWDAKLLKPQSRFPLNHVSEAVCFSSDGRFVATVPDVREAAGRNELINRTLTVWEAATGKAVWAASTAAGRAVCMAFSPDGWYLAVATTVGHLDQSLPHGEKSVQVYERLSGRLVRSIPLPDEEKVTAMTFAPNG